MVQEKAPPSRDANHYELREIPRWRRIVFPLLAPVIALFFRLYFCTCRVTVIGGEHLDALVREGEPIIPCYWHQNQFVCAYYLFRLRRHDFSLGALVSPSRDGELAAQVIEHLGGVAIRGSATRTGAQAMRDLYLRMKNDGVSPVMTPDGSQGPIHVFKHGSVMLAQLSGAPMVPIACAARHAWKLNTWDRTQIPWPFTRLVFAVGEPRYAERQARFGEESPLQEEMATTLKALEESASQALRNG